MFDSVQTSSPQAVVHLEFLKVAFLKNQVGSRPVVFSRHTCSNRVPSPTARFARSPPQEYTQSFHDMVTALLQLPPSNQQMFH